jgi:hypothetical protein
MTSSQFPEEKFLKKIERNKKRSTAKAQYDLPKFSSTASLDLKHYHFNRLAKQFVRFIDKHRCAKATSLEPSTIELCKFTTFVPHSTPFHVFFQEALSSPESWIHSVFPSKFISIESRYYKNRWHPGLYFTVNALSSDVEFRTFFDEESNLVVYVEHPKLYDFFSRHLGGFVNSYQFSASSNSFALFLRTMLPSIYIIKANYRTHWRFHSFSWAPLYYDAVHAEDVFNLFKKHHSVTVPIPKELQSTDVYFPRINSDSASGMPSAFNFEHTLADRQLPAQQKKFQRREKDRKLSISRRNARRNSF